MIPWGAAVQYGGQHWNIMNGPQMSNLILFCKILFPKYVFKLKPLNFYQIQSRFLLVQ